MLKSHFGHSGKTSRHSKTSGSRFGHHWRGIFEALESRQLLSVTLPKISDVTLPAGTTVYIPLNGSSSGHTVNYAVTATDYSEVTPVMMPATDTSLEFNVDINGTSQVMDFQLFDKLSPATTAAIESYVKSGYYDGLQIYRNYQLGGSPALLQGGNDPVVVQGDNVQSKVVPIKEDKSQMAEEFNPNLQYTTAGLLGMARTNSPGTSTTEFFIMETGGDTVRSFLDYSYTIFGMQTVGMSVDKTIAGMQDQNATQDTGGAGYLVTPVTITSASLFTDTQNGVLQLSAPTSATGTVTITVTANDGTDSPATQTFVVTIQPDNTSNPANPFASKIPTAPTSVTCTSLGGAKTHTTDLNNSDSSHTLQFLVSGVTSGNVVEILADGNIIGQATASGSTVTVTTDGSTGLTDGEHEFTAIQIAKNQTVSVTENSTAVNKTANVPSFNSPAFSLTVETPPTATAILSDMETTNTSVTFSVTYKDSLDEVKFSTIDNNDVVVIGPDGVSHAAELQSTTPQTDSSEVKAVYQALMPTGWKDTNLGDYTITMESAQVSDIQGNYVAGGKLLEFNPSDTMAPTATVARADGQADPTKSSPINFTVVFSEPVTDFLTATVKPTGTAVVSAPNVKITDTKGDGTTFNVAVSGMTGSGTVILTLPAGIAHDAAGNPNVASNSITVNYDITGPTVTINQKTGQADPTNATPITFTVTFSEPVTDFDQSDVKLQFLKYSVTDLGTLGGTTSEAYAINNAGQVVGTSSLTSSGSTTHAFIYSGGHMIDIGALDASYRNSYAYGINEKGQVVGYGDFSSNDSLTDAFLYNGSEIIDLSTALSGISGGQSEAQGINDSGQAVGYDGASTTSSVTSTAFVYSESGVSSIPNLGGSSSYAYAIDDNGDVVGYSTLASGDTHAFLWNGTRVVDLQTLGGSSSYAYAINDKGDVVGTSTLADGSWHVFEYASSQTSPTMVDLGALNSLSTVAYAINGDGEIVGTAYQSSQQGSSAFLYDGATTVDLNNLLNSTGKGWQLLEAKGINDSGQIVGYGVNPAGLTHAFLLNPVDAMSATPTISITPVGTDGKTYTVSVSGITGSGQLVATIPAGAVHDSLGNSSTASTSTDNRVTYDYAGPVVTVSRATAQIARTSAATIHFTVTFDETVTDFTADDVTLGGTALGNLAATVTGSGKTYDVAVTGMTSTGTVVATVAAGKAHDSLGNSSSASTGSDNSVQFVLATPPTFRVTAPQSVKFTVGQTAVIAWNITNVIARTKVSLYYDKDTVWNGNEKLLTSTTLTMTNTYATNGYNTAQWNTTGMTPGTYYICGYLMSGTKILSHLTQAVTIAAVPQPTFRVTTPTSGTYTAGTDVTVWWTSANAPTGSTVSLYYDKDTVWNGNEKLIVSNHTTTVNTYDKYTWSTTGMASGKYYLAGYLRANGKNILAHLTQTITIIAAPKPSFRVTSPVSGTYTVGQDVKVYWLATNAPASSTVSLCYDTDTAFNGNEHWVQTNLNNSQMPAVSGYRYASFNTTGMTPGKYYVAGCLSANGTTTYSHLGTPITITAAALMVDASAPRLANAPLLTEEQLQPIVVEAERRLTAATGIQVSSAMSGASVRIVDLPGNMLGEAVGNTIYVDQTAAGYGWFVDSTPADDREFADMLGPYALAARKGTAAANRVDLLTTVMHEMSHVLGYGHSDSLDLMYPTLLPGERRFLNEQLPPLPISGQNPTGSFSDARTDTDVIDQLFGSISSDKRKWVLT